MFRNSSANKNLRKGIEVNLTTLHLKRDTQIMMTYVLSMVLCLR